MIKTLTSLFLFVIISGSITAQAVWENQSHEVYPYLYRLSQKGFIDFQDIIRPVSRNQISALLLELEAKDSLLNQVEKKELSFYLQEFRPLTEFPKKQIQYIKKDSNARIRALFVHTKDFQLNVDPIGSFMQVSGTNQNFSQMSNGLQFWGQAKRFSFQFYYRDYTETGTGIDSFRNESPETGIIKLYNAGNTNTQNFSEVRANISYTWNNGSISVGKDHLFWGYGENGRTVLSNKAPSYPYIRLDYQPFKWLQFNFSHAWLNSNIVDSNASYYTGTGVSGGERIIYRKKFMSTHSFLFKPLKGLDIALGESIVYSDNEDIGFLIPVNFYKVYDNNRSNYNINAGSNGQLFFQVSSRNHLKNTHIYGSMFIDEINASKMFDAQKSRNQFGYTLGASITDPFIRNLTIGAEYTRVNPFVYSNIIPAQFYTQYDYSLGDWMGNNFDRQIFFLKYTPIPKLKVYLRYQAIRKGGPGTIYQQYLAEPQPPFLFDFQKKRTDLFVELRYEWVNNFYFTGSYQSLNNDFANGTKNTMTTFQLGFSYGLK